ncbi:MAG TPA: DoxX family protein [Acidobacteriaceae bacterium]|nr:DoxX family protein [Acidobacteriaceae bacterium]
MRYLTFPQLTQYSDWGILALRVMIAAVFSTSGFNHLKAPRKRAESLGMNIGFVVFLGLAEFLGGIAMLLGFLTQWDAIGFILIMLGAIWMKIAVWKSGFWGEKSMGWHYDLIFIAMNLAVLFTNGGNIAMFGHRF